MEVYVTLGFMHFALDRESLSDRCKIHETYIYIYIYIYKEEHIRDVTFIITHGGTSVDQYT